MAPLAQLDRLIVSHSFIPVFMDVDESRAGRAAQRYGVSAIPTILVINASGEVVNAAQFLSRTQMLAFLKESGARK